VPIDYDSLEYVSQTVKNYQNTDLLIVTKNRNEIDIKGLIDLGYFRFGENRVQEALRKFSLFPPKILNSLDLHLIGPLQSNKTRKALEIFNVIQSIDRKKIIDEISLEMKKLNHHKTNAFFLQVNIGEEDQKFGIHPKDIEDLYKYAISQKLNIIGLMCIPPNNHDPRKYFQQMIKIRDKIDIHLKLSMGMSSDYKIALDCGSNIIRVGSKIFS
jgi:pyridoxal phosphate enzyme (YggS family)